MIKAEIIRSKKRNFIYLSKVDILEVWDSYYGYLSIPGFEERKQALHDYLVQIDEKARMDLNKFMKKKGKKIND